MNTSTTLTKIGIALADAHKAMPTLVKDASNPHFKSRYLSLDGLLGAVRGPLLAHGILIVQSANASDDTGIGVITRLQHTSGEFIEGTVRVPLEKPTPQAAGSALSYGRRYGLEAILGLTGTEDDDGNTAEVHAVNAPAKRPGPVVQERAVPTAPRPTTSPAAGGPVMPFGRTKGTPMAQLKDEEIQSALDWAVSKEKFTEFQAEARAELDRRVPAGLEGPDDDRLPF
jgi:hypothetical protein